MASPTLLLFLASIYCISIQIAHSATSCNRGYYLDNDNCYPCEPGSYCPDGYRKLPCNPGEYQDSFASSSCASCRNGYFTTKTGSITCEICPIGAMCPNSDRDPISCPPGAYQDSYGAVGCQQCQAGMTENQTTLSLIVHV